MLSSWSLRLFVGACLVLGVASAQFEVGRVVGHDQQGGNYAVADIDGDTAIVGNSYNGTSSFGGAAYVFVRVAGNWIEEAKLLPSDVVVGGEFGCAVAIDGNHAFVGASRNTGNVANAGAVYVFRRTGSFPFASWSQQSKLVAADTVSLSQFGYALAHSNDTLAIGAPGNGGGPGAVYVFAGSGATWSQQAKLVYGSTIGQSVALDNDTLLIGRLNFSAPYCQGLVYERVSGAWALTATLVPPTQAGDFYAYSVALSGDVALVGSPHESPANLSGDGAAYLFTRQAGQWSAGVLLQPTNPVNGGNFGSCVAIEGSRAVIALPNDGTGGLLVAFNVQPGQGSQAGVLKPDFPSPGLNLGIGRGSAVGLDGDLVVAAGHESVIFSLVPPAPVAYCSAKVNSQGCLPAMSSVGSASATAAAPFLLNAQAVLNQKFGLLFFGSSGRTAFPFQGGTLCVLPPIRRTVTQNSAGSTGAADCSGTYSFDFNAFVQSGVYPDLIAGTRVNCQYWSRDPASPSTTGLTDAIEFGIGF